ncbi:MAG: hypothetical protein QJR02_01960 [Sinobacteraceae bacterium]|nr:hypothetical protein [Nevskiaceae bacterium]
MPVASVPFQTYGVEIQDVQVEEAQNLSQPRFAATPIRAVGVAAPEMAAATEAGATATPTVRPAAPLRVMGGTEAAYWAGKAGEPIATVHFHIGTTQEVPQDAHALDAVKADDSQCYVVVGHSDPSGPYQLIGPLSLARAEEVADQLNGRVELVGGAGARQPRAPRDEWPRERRADVYGKACGG